MDFKELKALNEDKELQKLLIEQELKQLASIKEFLKNIPAGRKLYLNLGPVMVESNYLEVLEYLEEKEKELKSKLLELS